MKICLKSPLHKPLFFLFSMLILICSYHKDISADNIVTQMRTPVSLGELLHEGLLTIQEDIGQLEKQSSSDREIILTYSLQKIGDLQNLYDTMNAKSRLNEIHNDERDFLQTLIDRIDQMIQQIEGKTSDSDSQNDLIKKNIDLLHMLRNALET